MTRYPKAGEGQRWTIRELLAIPETWKGDTLSDGGGLSGEVRIGVVAQMPVAAEVGSGDERDELGSG